MGDYVKAQEFYEQGESLFVQVEEVYLRKELRAQLADVALAHHLLSADRAAVWRRVPCPNPP
jgi:hypothetical protein